MQNNTDNQVHAGFFVRLAAYLIDSLIVGVALLIVRMPFWISSWISPNNVVVRDLIFTYSIEDIVLYILGALYFIVLTYRTGATIGKRLLHLRVVSVEERKVTLFEVVYRETVGRFLAALIANIGYFMIAVHGEKRGLHDLLSDTEVVYCHKKEVVVETPIEYEEVPKVYMPVDYVMPDKQELPNDILRNDLQETPEEDVMETEVDGTLEIEEDMENENSN